MKFASVNKTEKFGRRRARFSSPLLFSLFLALIFSFAGQMDIARAAVPSVVPLSDTDGDGFPEIGIFIRNAANTKNRSYVMDANSGPADYVIKLGIPSNLDPLFQVVVPDLNSNGSPELAMLGVTYASGVIDTVRVIIKDTLTGSAIINMGFDKDFPPVAMAVVEYPSGHTASNVGIAVLGRRLPTGGPGTSLTKVSVRDAVSGAIITNTYYMQTFTPIAMAVIPDITGTAGGLTNAPEIAVLGLRDADVTWGGVVSVILTDVGAGAANNGWVTFIGMDSNVNPVDMVAIPDMNGNGSMELAVVGINLTNGNGVVSIREPIKVSGVSPTLNTLVFPPEYPAVSIEAVPDFTDVNGTGSANGMPEIAVFGLGDPTAGDGSGVLDRTKVYVRDASAVTGEWIGILSFGESFPTKAMVVVDNYNSIAPYTSAPELAVLGVDGGGTMLVTTKDILYDGAKIDSFYVPPEYQISANVTNLGSQGQLRLRNNGIWAAGITADGTYSPPGWLTSDEANYVVTVHSSSPVQNCVITGGSNGDGSGEVGLSPVTVDVDCTPPPPPPAFDPPPANTKSNLNYSDNTFGLITAARLQGWKSNWAANKPSAISGKLVILNVDDNNYYTPYVAGTGVDCSNVYSFNAHYSSSGDPNYGFEEKRNNGLFDTVSMVADGDTADRFLKMYNIDPANDMVVVAMRAFSNVNFFYYGRIHYMLRYWGMDETHLALLNGPVINQGGAIDSSTIEPCTTHGLGTWTVQGLPDNTGLQASTGEMLAVARGDFTPDAAGYGTAYFWDTRTPGEYAGTPSATYTRDETFSTYVAFEGTINIPTMVGDTGGNLPWNDPGLIDANGFFKTLTEIDVIHVANGFVPGQTVYTWCRTAWRAMASYIAAAVVHGCPTKVYDGSWIEWGELADSTYGGGLPSGSVYAADNVASTTSLNYNISPRPTSSAYPTNVIVPTNPPGFPTASQVIIDDKAYKGITWSSGLAVPGGLNNEEY